MNKIIAMFLVLLIIFGAAWVIKTKAPINKQINDNTPLSNWWDDGTSVKALSNEVSDEWILDPRIPEDYVPVLGYDNLYMQIDENGKIIAYWECTEDGDTLSWKKVNPDIPDYYEPVEGLEDVYKVTDANGNVLYYKYIRNDDNTFTFVEVDKNGNIIDEYITTCEAIAASNNDIPSNYTQISGNIYAVKNKDGVTVGYKEKNEDSDGTLIWTPVKNPYSGSNGSSSSGNSRNSGSVTNIPIDTSGGNNQTQTGYATAKRTGTQTGGGQQTLGTQTLPNYTLSGQTLPDPGGPTYTDQSGYTYRTGTLTNGEPYTYYIEQPTVTTAPNQQTPPTNTVTGSVNTDKDTHVQKETYTETQIEGEYRCTYEYTIIKTFDKYGNLLTSEQQGPFLVNKEYIGSSNPQQPNKSLIESNIDNEILRVTNGLDNRSDCATNVINNLNAERQNSGVSMLSTNGDAQKLAILFAADMAIYDNTSNTSPMYGTMDNLMDRYGISNQGYGINVWRTNSDDAERIHKRFQSVDGCREARMNAGFDQVGVAVFGNNGYYYVAEIIMKQ